MCVPQSLAGHRPISTGLEHFSVRLHKERARRQYGDRCGRSRSPSRSDGGDPAAIPNPLDTAMNVALPEFDGRMISVPVAFKTQPESSKETGTHYEALPERAERV